MSHSPVLAIALHAFQIIQVLAAAYITLAAVLSAFFVVGHMLAMPVYFFRWMKSKLGSIDETIFGENSVEKLAERLRETARETKKDK